VPFIFFLLPYLDMDPRYQEVKGETLSAQAAAKILRTFLIGKDDDEEEIFNSNEPIKNVRTMLKRLDAQIDGQRQSSIQAVTDNALKLYQTPTKRV